MQTWAIIPKIREIDQVLRADPTAQGRFCEVHPEICFWAWNDRLALAHKKKSCDGRMERRALIDAHFGPLAVGQVRERFRAREVAFDDICDAFAALWTAERIAAGTAVVIPEQPATDSVGLQMGIWY
jgi:predicted RNase H-like nuclease